MKKLLTCVIVSSVLTGTALATPIMHVHDRNGTLGKVDVETGNVEVIGSFGVVLNDIAFNGAGDLFGVSFTSFYSINPETAATTFIGRHGISGANALVFSDDGTLYAAGYSTRELYSLDTTSGLSTSLGNMGYRSGGDLAFNDGNFYLASSSNQLVYVDLDEVSNSYAVGNFGVSGVVGLATGDDEGLYAVSGTNIYEVDVTTGRAFNPVSYANQGMVGAHGQSFFNEAVSSPETPTTGGESVPVPEPGAMALILTGLGILRLRRRES